MSKNDLINEKISPEKYEKYHDHLLEQYKIYVATAESVSTKRGLSNTFFLSLNTFILTGLTILYENGFKFDPVWIIIFPAIALLTLCWAWWRLNVSYKQLNSAKFKVIDAFEEHLPARPFVSTEWERLGKGKNPALYKPLTDIENWVPGIFASLYIFGVIVAMCLQ